MKLRDHPPLHLTYCLNVHPGEAWDDQLAAIRDKAAAIRDRLGVREPFGLGLRVSNRASLDLAQPGRTEELRALLVQQNMYAFTVNGFPYGTFHGTAVKEDVYRPDWRAPERLDYTLRLADFLAGVLPADVPGSISTAPGSYKAWIKTPADIEAMVANLSAVAVRLAEIEAGTGALLTLGLEPEPDCFIETTAETVAFFEDHVFRSGVRQVCSATGRTASAAEALLRRHLGVCFDTCHLALQFEDLAESLRHLSRHGIGVSKIQLSAALRVNPVLVGSSELEPFRDHVYLHQVKAVDAAGQVAAYRDLGPDVLADIRAQDAVEVRSHFHVPLYWTGSGTLRSSAELLTPEFWRTGLAQGIAHWEIETYTFHVLPPEMRALGVEESVAQEYRWVQSALQPHLAAAAAGER